MNIWYAVYVTGQKIDVVLPPIALFQYQSHAADFVKQQYPNRAEIKPVALNATLRPVVISEDIIRIQ